MPRGYIHHYHISITPDKCPRKVNRDIIGEILEYLKKLLKVVQNYPKLSGDYIRQYHISITPDKCPSDVIGELFNISKNCPKLSKISKNCLVIFTIITSLSHRTSVQEKFLGISCITFSISKITDYGRPKKPFFIEIQNFWAWADKFCGIWGIFDRITPILIL